MCGPPAVRSSTGRYGIQILILSEAMSAMRRQIVRFLFLLMVSAVANANSQKASPTIIDLTDTIRVGMVEDSIGDAAMKAFGMRPGVQVVPNLTGKTNTRRPSGCRLVRSFTT